MNPNKRALDHRAGRRPHGDLERGARDVAEPRAAEDVVHVLVVPEAEGTHRALTRSREPWRRDEGRRAVPVCHGLCSTPCQQAKTKRPPGRSPARMAPKAASGSSKNITPELADGKVEGLGAQALGLHVTDDERDVRHAGLTRPLAGQLDQRRRDVDPDHLARRPQRSGQSDGLRSSAAPDVADPLLRVSKWVGRRQHVRRQSLGEPLPLGPRRHPLLVVPALRFPLVGHWRQRNPPR